jgi:hypothetical protein
MIINQYNGSRDKKVNLDEICNNFFINVFKTINFIINFYY